MVNVEMTKYDSEMVVEWCGVSVVVSLKCERLVWTD